MWSDADVTAWWSDLEVPGLFDVHTHFLPENVQRKVWAQFDQAGPKIGREWPIRYRGSHQERVEQLRAMGVRRFSSLPYAHKPGIADYLNGWAAEFSREVPDCLWSATMYPEESSATYIPELIAAGLEIVKVHAQVGEFRLDDPLLDEAWGALAEAGTPIVVHVGSGPIGNEFTGPDHLARLLRRHPTLRVIVAHMGAPEYADFVGLAERYDGLLLDTTMVFTDFFDVEAPYPADLAPRLAGLGPRVVLGSDFPTIPYPYAHQLEGLERFALSHAELGVDWLREVCWHTGVRLLGEPPAAPRD